MDYKGRKSGLKGREEWTIREGRVDYKGRKSGL